MVQICFNNKEIGSKDSTDYNEIVKFIVAKTLLRCDEFYLTQNGKRIENNAQNIVNNKPIHCLICVFGGKGGFGSMLRAIGAQIEKTTNREACRDLSGRRLRDINEEKRLKAWLEKQGDRDREAEERKKRKIEKLLAMPKHEFKDKEYEDARTKLTEKVNDAVEEGFKKVLNNGNTDQQDKKKADKRRAVSDNASTKKKKPALWIGDEFSDSDESDDDSSVNLESAENIMKKTNGQSHKQELHSKKGL